MSQEVLRLQADCKKAAKRAADEKQRLEATRTSKLEDLEIRSVGNVVPVIDIPALKAKIKRVAFGCQDDDEDTCYFKFKAIAKILLAESKRN